MRTRSAALATALLLMPTSGCTHHSSRPQAALIHGESAGRLPSETLVDWVSYADGVLVATVASEKEIPLQPGDVNVAGEGLQGRTLTLRVERRVWTRAGSRPVPDEFAMKAPGWALKGFTKRPFTTGPVRLEVGTTYLIALAYVYDEGWSQLGSETVARVGPDGRPLAEGRVSNPALSALVGKSPEEIASSLRSTAPDPLAAKHFDLDAVHRWSAVQKELGQPVTG